MIESYGKLPFYAPVLVDQHLRHRAGRGSTCSGSAATIGRGWGPHGGYVLVDDGSGASTSSVLGVRFTTVDGPKLRRRWDGGSIDL